MKKTIKDYVKFCDENKLTEKHRMMALNAYKKSCKIEADREKQKKRRVLLSKDKQNPASEL